MKYLIFLSFSLFYLTITDSLSSISLFSIFGKHFWVKIVAFLLFLFDLDLLFIFTVTATALLFFLFDELRGILSLTTIFISVEVGSLYYSGSSSMVINYFGSSLFHRMIKSHAFFTMNFIRSMTDMLLQFSHLLLDNLLLGLFLCKLFLGFVNHVILFQNVL